MSEQFSITLAIAAVAIMAGSAIAQQRDRNRPKQLEIEDRTFVVVAASPARQIFIHAGGLLVVSLVPALHISDRWVLLQPVFALGLCADGVFAIRFRRPVTLRSDGVVAQGVFGRQTTEWDVVAEHPWRLRRLGMDPTIIWPALRKPLRLQFFSSSRLWSPAIGAAPLAKVVRRYIDDPAARAWIGTTGELDHLTEVVVPRP